MTTTRRHPERTEQARIVQLLRSIGCAVYTIGTTRRRGDHPGTMMTPGFPDVLAFLPHAGGPLFVEVKTPKGRLRPEQAAFRARCLETAPPCLVGHVVGGLDAVTDWLIDRGYLTERGTGGGA